MQGRIEDSMKIYLLINYSKSKDLSIQHVIRWIPPLMLFQVWIRLIVGTSTRYKFVMVSLKAYISTSGLLIPPFVSPSVVIMLNYPPNTHRSFGYKFLRFTKFCNKAPLSPGIWGPYNPVNITHLLDPIFWNFPVRILGRLPQSSNHTSSRF